MTYGESGIKGAGPTRPTPMINIIPPMTATALGRKYLSHSQPHTGADEPYVAPVTTKTSPNATGVKLNCKNKALAEMCTYRSYHFFHFEPNPDLR